MNFLLILWVVLGVILFYGIKGDLTEAAFKSDYHRYVMYAVCGPGMWALAVFFMLLDIVDLGVSFKPWYTGFLSGMRKVFFA